MSNYSEKIYEISFSNKVSKDAYLEACKWLALNVYGTPLAQWITVKITKFKKKKGDPTFVVELFATINEEEVKNSFCKKCKQMYTIFYSIDKPRCEECKAFLYRKELKDQIEFIHDKCKEVLNESNT